MKAKWYRVTCMCVAGYYKGHQVQCDVQSNTKQGAAKAALRRHKNSYEPNINSGTYKVETVEDVPEKKES